MTYQEFTEISGQEISFEDYDKIVEPMYMGSNMNKYDFCKTLKQAREVARQYA